MNCETGQLDWEDFARKVNERTKIIAVGAASNALGTINDVARAAELAHSVGALVLVDAVHYAPHRLVDVRELDCDLLMCSAYKFYGPHIGVMYGRREVLQRLPFPKLQPASDAAPERAETGTLNHEGIAGVAATVEFLVSLGRTGESRRERLQNAFAELDERGTALMRRLWEGLAECDGVTLYGPGPEEPRTSTVAFTIRSLASQDVARRLSEQGLFLSHGDFYAATVVERFGLKAEGLVRAGCACYTTDEETDRLLAEVRKLAQ
jgi:selenocysteine lyase/cysteine desulfurase